jgi:muramidase (phage lysozyme)
VLALNVTLLAGYTLGCHSLRHLVGGFRIDQISRHPVKHACYQGVQLPQPPATCAGRGRLVTVAFADVYVRLCSMGIWTDWRIL